MESSAGSDKRGERNGGLAKLNSPPGHGSRCRELGSPGLRHLLDSSEDVYVIHCVHVCAHAYDMCIYVFMYVCMYVRMYVCMYVCIYIYILYTLLGFLRGSSVKLGKMQRRLARPLRKDDAHESTGANFASHVKACDISQASGEVAELNLAPALGHACIIV